MDDYPSSVKSAARVLDMFELLAQRGTGLSHTALSEALHIPKSSLTKLIANLVQRGYLSFSATDKTYRLGTKFSDLARRTSRQQDLIGLAEPLLTDITRSTGESAAFNMLDGLQLKVVAAVNSEQPLVSHMRLGDIAPLHATSAGKAILAFLPDSALENYIASGLTAITQRTITSPAELRRQLDRVRADRIAEVCEEFTPGVAGIAVPILSPENEPLGAINVAMPAIRYNDETRQAITAALRNAAAILQQRLALS